MANTVKDSEVGHKAGKALSHAISINAYPTSRPMYVVTLMKLDGNIESAEALIRKDAQSQIPEISSAAFRQMHYFDSAERFLPVVRKTLEERSEPSVIRSAINFLFELHRHHDANEDQIDLSPCVPAIAAQLEKQKDVYHLQDHLLRFLVKTNHAKHCPVEPIIAMLSYKNDTNHYEAVRVLQAMGKSAKPALSVLRKIQGDPDRTLSPSLRKAIAETIQHLSKASN